METRPVYIAGMGFHHPERRLTNAELEGLVETSDAWILEHTGIAERRRAAADVNTSDLGVLATRRALDATGWQAADLDLLVCATSSPDTLLPSAGAHIVAKLGVDTVAFDVNAACAGFPYAMATVRSFVQSGAARRAALCCADKYTRLTDYTDRRSCVLFGDGAATLLIQPERPRWGAEVVDVALSHWRAGLPLVQVPVGGFWHLEPGAVTGPALERLDESAREMLERHGLRAADLRAFMAHQANYRLLEALEERLEVPPDRHWHNVRTKGNQGAAGVLTTLCAGVEKHADSLHEGDLVLLTAVGAGYTAGSVLLRWIRAS